MTDPAWRLARMAAVTLVACAGIILLATAPAKAITREEALCLAIDSGQTCALKNQIAEFQCKLLAQGYTWNEVLEASQWPRHKRDAWMRQSVRFYCPGVVPPSPSPSWKGGGVIGEVIAV